MENKTVVKAGKIRLQIYTMIQKITGRDITEKEHAMLKAILMDFQNTVVPKKVQVPTEHSYTCVDCGGVKKGIGKKFKKKMNRIKVPKKI